MEISILISNMTQRYGTERAVANLSAILVHLGHHVTIYSVYSSAGTAAFDLPPSVEIKHCGLKFSKEESWLQKIRRKIRFLFCISAIKSDILIGTEVSFNILLRLSKSEKCIGCEHMNYAFAPKYLRMCRRIAYRFLDAVVLLTEKDAKKYDFIKQERRFVIPNSLPFEIPPAMPHDSREILAIGRLMRQKGFDMLIAAAVEIRKRHEDWHVSIVGGGEEQERLQQQIQRSGLAGFVSLEASTLDIQRYYGKASIYAMSSRWEGFPMVLLEAQAFGLPVVSFDCPEGPADIISHGENGFLVPANDIGKLAKKINELIECPEKRKAFGAAARENAEKYSEPVIRVLWAGLIADLTKTPKHLKKDRAL